MNITEAIKTRRSVRSFNGEHLPAATVATLRKAIEESSSPFGGSVTIRLESFDLRGPFKPATYGMISGAGEYFLIGSLRDKASALTVGYRFEQIVLKAWQMGLGTCWIAATFKGTDFERDEKWPDGEELLIVSPVGIPAKPTIKEKLTRMTIGSKNRKPFDKLFFDENFDTPLLSDSRYGNALEMMRLAPSSTNSQPWRALVKGDTVIFYYKPKGAVSIIDCGIGLYHFDATERYTGKTGRFIVETDVPAPPGNWIYLISYKPDGQ